MNAKGFLRRCRATWGEVLKPRLRRALQGRPVLGPLARWLYRGLRFFLRLLLGSPPVAAAAAAPAGPVPVPDDLPNVSPMRLRLGSFPGDPYLNVLIPGLARRHMSGGPNTAIQLSLRLARAGLPVRYVSTCVPMEDAADLWEHFHRVTGIAGPLPNVAMVTAHDRSATTWLGEDDVFLGTAWWTVQMIKHILPRSRVKKFLYLIQDYEPGFYPWSTVHALALETYGLNFEAVINERSLLDLLVHNRAGRFADPDFADSCLVFEPAVDRQRFYPEWTTEPRRKRLLFYARPQAPRNLYELGLLALKQAVERGAFCPHTWDLCFMGENLPDADLGHGVVIRSLPWFSYDAYAAQMRRSDVGLTLMLSPHTSYPPLEMAACGLSVVTNSYATKTAAGLRALSTNLLPVAPTLESVVEGLLWAARRTENWEARRAGSAIQLPGSWDEVFEPLVPGVLRMVDNCRRGIGSSREADRRAA
jgi:hypothetical protein